MLYLRGSGGQGIEEVAVVGTVTLGATSGSILQSVTAVGVAAVLTPAAPLAKRITMIVHNVGSTTIFLGSSTVTAGTTATGGVQLLAGQSVSLNLSPVVLLYAISSAAGGLVACLEVAS